MAIPFNYHAASWWLRKVHEIQFNAQWIPQKVPTLIVSATHDFIVPSVLFEQDERFKRENIQFTIIQHAGHFPWIEQPAEVKKILNVFFKDKKWNNLLTDDKKVHK